MVRAARVQRAAGIAVCLLLAAVPAGAQEKDARRACQAAVQSGRRLISVPFQLNYDDGYGANNSGNRWTLNFQPVVPMSISESWNMISRTIVPL